MNRMILEDSEIRKVLKYLSSYYLTNVDVMEETEKEELRGMINWFTIYTRGEGELIENIKYTGRP